METLFQEHKFKQDQTYNCNESDFPHVYKSAKVIATKVKHCVLIMTHGKEVHL